MDIRMDVKASRREHDGRWVAECTFHFNQCTMAAREVGPKRDYAVMSVVMEAMRVSREATTESSQGAQP